MMFFVRNFLGYIFLRLVIVSSQINLHLTDWENENKDNIILQNNCLYVVASIKKESDPYQIISYCLTQHLTKLNIQQNSHDQKFTFIQLYQENITSQQLYLWSAPIDLIERYQFYLNQLSTSNANNLSSMASQIFYNCTSPRFGPLCQYSLDILTSDNSSLNKLIHDFYQQEYFPNTLTCYTHLECNRGSPSMCLDWSEICDGIVDCQDGIDEKFCWQLETNECNDNEYRCHNGQCISKIFYRDDPKTFECLDRSDEVTRVMKYAYNLFSDINGEPTFTTEDISCSGRYAPLTLKLTSSCLEKRSSIFKEILWSDKPNSVSDNCWTAIRCELFTLHYVDPLCRNLCFDGTCKEIINRSCPDMMNIPAGTLTFSHIFFVYMKEDIINRNFWSLSPAYVCYNDLLCDGLYPNKSLILFNNATCRRPEDFPFTFVNTPTFRHSWYDIYVTPLYEQLSQCNKINYNDFINCNNLIMYECINSSKCISKHRLCDGNNDCPFHDDEQCSSINESCSLYGLDNLFKCTMNGVCISATLINDGHCQCGFDQYGLCDDETSDLTYIRKHISFPTVCDGFTELIPIIIDGWNETDETGCEYWKCNNTYTRCDGFWNCFNGADEVDCDPLPILKCPSHHHHHHICVSPIFFQFMCLPLEKANDGIVDCLGGTDEPKLCRSNDYQLTDKTFYCITDADEGCIYISNLCYTSVCKDRSDQQLCSISNNRTFGYSFCWDNYDTNRSNVQNFFCTRQIDINKPKVINFALDKFTNAVSSQFSIEQTMILQQEQVCHRGLPLRLWINTDENVTNTTCLCPPSFYGEQCQYQNQRVSLTLRFQTYSDSRQTLFALIISLIDHTDQRLIHSYQQITYLYTEHCKTKFNIYLLYGNRPQILTNNYSIHIDIYEKISFLYRGSLFIPIIFSFLPVYRIAVQLNIPRMNDNKKTCSDEKCIHGRCMKYSEHSKEISFCQCDREWSGKYCTLSHTCSCSSDSLCIGISANNRSICVCPIDKWGSRCLLQKTICYSDQNTTCQNGGQCIVLDENMISNKTFICMCPKGFSGKRCEKTDSKIMISFDKNIILPPFILIHFIRVMNNGPPENGSTFKFTPIQKKSITIQWSHPFHIAFVEFLNQTYYLITVQNIYNRSLILSKTIYPSDRCKHLSELLDETIIKLHLLRRIKYYHLPCQLHSSSLSCFYDDNHFCLCHDFDDDRIANCFEFNSSIKYDCFGESNCENEAQCLQDKASCPQTSICICQTCFYGTRCQFSSNLFSLSLDAILGYHIQPHIDINHQPYIVQVSIGLTILMFIAGLINGIISLIIFTNKQTHRIGSGFYLFSSSIITLFTMTIFALKFSILIIAQIIYITNRSFLQFQCILLDFLLRFGLNMNQWLNACVTMERAIIAIKGLRFNKDKSKQLARKIIFILLFINISTIIHDPIYRHLIDDINNEDEKRIWCIVTYPTNIQIFNLIINIFHFSIPFLINFISAFIIIRKIAQQRRRIQINRTYRQLFYEQFQQHSHLFVSPLLLIILTIPRLFLSLTSGCMKSINDSWLFINGYFISFIPPTLTFIIFGLPSKLYRKQLYKFIKRIRQLIQNRVLPIF